MEFELYYKKELIKLEIHTDSCTSYSITDYNYYYYYYLFIIAPSYNNDASYN